MDHILFEPFKIKMVEPLPITSAAQRDAAIRAAHFNVFALHADQVTIDLLTDSGTGAMSDRQWGAMLSGDESYAGSRSFLELEEAVRALTGMEHIIPVHQGRAAEHLLFSTILKPGDLVLSNGLFDTTHANVNNSEAEGVNLPCVAGLDPFALAPFKGNIDLELLERHLTGPDAARVRAVVMTITNNTGGGQPVSLENLQAVRVLCTRHGKLLVLDSCRFAENSYFIKLRESTHSQKNVTEIARSCFDLADVMTFSAKKDAFSNIGGLLALRDQSLAKTLRNKMVVIEGFPSYGGLAGYSLAAMTQGLKEVVDENYLKYRLRTVEWAVERLIAAGVPVVRPAGGHAVYLEAARFFPQIKREEFPGLILTTELYRRGGIRGCELGSVAFGVRNSDGSQTLPPQDLVRLALPRRVYTEAHLGFVVETIIDIFGDRDKFRRGFGFLEEAPVLRHFNSKFCELSSSSSQ